MNSGTLDQIWDLYTINLRPTKLGQQRMGQALWNAASECGIEIPDPDNVLFYQVESDKHPAWGEALKYLMSIYED